MENNQLQPIHYVAQELSEKTIELATYKVAYQQLDTRVKELETLEQLINSNKELKELVEEIRNKGE